MNIVLFYHSLVSDWNHGNAHFLRGVAWDLRRRGHKLRIYEPADGWSLTNLIREQGRAPLENFYKAYPGLCSTFYELDPLDVDHALHGADLVLVHEWNDPALVRNIGEHRKKTARYRLFFHDTHHRSVTQPESMARYDLSAYDGVLAYGAAIREIYLARGWTDRAWVWHEAADPRIFRPAQKQKKIGDIVWIGNWGDNERTAELNEFLIDPVCSLGLKARVYGVRYSTEALNVLSKAGIEYGGWLPNFQVPQALAQFHVTLHIPRRPYARALAGIPTIRPFEAMACGTPLISAPWQDSEHLFSLGEDYLLARDGEEMKRCLHMLLDQPELQRTLAAHGRKTILERHTCAHRVDQLLAIYNELERTERFGEWSNGVVE